MKTLTKKEHRLSFGILILLIILGTNLYATSIENNLTREAGHDNRTPRLATIAGVQGKTQSVNYSGYS